jgi:Skp family chaperone for outer membrane proteins
MVRRYVAMAGIALCIVAGGPASAQVQRSGGGSESQKIMQQYQQVAAEKTALQAQVAQMKKDLDGTKADLAAMKKERDALKARAAGAAGTAAAVAELSASKQAAEKNLEVSKQRMTRGFAKPPRISRTSKLIRRKPERRWTIATPRSTSARWTTCNSTRSAVRFWIATNTSGCSRKSVRASRLPRSRAPASKMSPMNTGRGPKSCA